MLVAAISFYFIFSHKPYIDPAATQIPCLQSFIEMVDVRDIYGDVKENFVDPIPIPRLPVRLTRERQVNHNDLEMKPLLRRDPGGMSGYESGGEGGVRKDRLGSGEESLIVLSVPSSNHQTPPPESDILSEDQSFQGSDDQELLVRERKNKNDFRTS